MSELNDSISSEYTKTPGPRYIWQGKYSGEDFYQTVLKGLFERALSSDSILKINLDFTAGYGPSFLEESFGSLVRDFGLEAFKKHIAFESEEEPQLIDEISEYALDASK